MAIRRLRRPPLAISLTTGAQTLYEVRLSAAPSLAWRAAFFRLRDALKTTRFTPKLGRLVVDGTRLTFRTTPPQLHQWLRRIDQWIEYANSVAEE
jgi:hypothetical protein